MKANILVVEDEKNIAKLISYNLEKAEFACAVTASGEEALAYLQRHPADLIILDIMLPGMDGFETCRAIRQNAASRTTPIVMLTAKGEEVDRVVGLELGADDYMVKPFSPRELILRIKAILRRGKPQEGATEILSSGVLTVDIPRHIVLVRKKEVTLTPMEFKLLVTLMERKGRVQTRDRLLSDIWDMHSDVYTRTVDAHIKRLREKLGSIAGGYIETVVGLGYRFRESDEA